MTLQDHVIKGSGHFMEGNSLMYIPTLLKVIVIDIVSMDMQLFEFVTLFYKTTWFYGHVTLWVEVTKVKPSSCHILWPQALW